MKKCGCVNLRPNDAWIFILSTIRYSMGRRTYMTSLSQELFWMYKSLLLPEQIHQIRNEVQKEIEMYERVNKTLGDKHDHEKWKGFIDELDNL